ncbi:MAG TPA: hypothetical protein VNA68_02320 [Candidatus Dormibacteraeota bacterium]|nr:hypothetical protein [Candidatus Dormibacteraeota bacterium]
MEPNEYIMTVTSMEYRCKRDGKKRLGQVIQMGILQQALDLSALRGLDSLPTEVQATYRDPEMAREHGDLELEARPENIPLVIPHFGTDPLKGFYEPLVLSEPELKPWPEHLPLFIRELAAGTDAVKEWFCERGGQYPEIYAKLVAMLEPT